MKSAEEFMLNMLKIFDSNAQFPEVMSPEEKVEWNKVVMIYNQNQLDAFKAGMERAADILDYEIVASWPPSSRKGTLSALQQAILSASNSLTIKDLK